MAMTALWWWCPAGSRLCTPPLPAALSLPSTSLFSRRRSNSREWVSSSSSSLKSFGRRRGRRSPSSLQSVSFSPASIACCKDSLLVTKPALLVGSTRGIQLQVVAPPRANGDDCYCHCCSRTCGLKHSSSVKCRAKQPRRQRSEFDDYIDPAKAEPFEAEDEEDEEMTKFDRVAREAAKVRKQQEAEYKRTKPIFMKAIGLAADAEEEEEEEEEDDDLPEELLDPDDDFFNISQAVSIKKKQAKASQKKNKAAVAEFENLARTPPKTGPRIPLSSLRLSEDDEEEDNLLEEEEEEEEPAELEEEENVADVQPEADEEEAPEEEYGAAFGGLHFDGDDDDDGEEDEEMSEPHYRMTLGELLDEARVTPISIEGDLDADITGIQHDSRQVSPGDLFVCVKGLSLDGHDFATQAVERGAVAIVASGEIAALSASEGLKAIVLVDDTNAILSALAGAFYGHPSQSLAVVGITGTNGKTTTSYLLRSMYEAMGLQTGLLGTINYFINNKKKLDAPNTTPDAVYLQKLMATMVHSRTDACIMEVSSHAMVLERCKEIDFDIAVFTNLTRDHMDFHKTEDEYKAAKGKLFAKMVDPERHRKVANIDDPNAAYFINQGNPDVPVVTFGIESVDADIFPLEVQLSLFETELLVRTPKGNIEISSGLLGRHNVYNILAAVAVGVAVEAPLEDIVRGIEEVDSVPGRCELIDEEQAFAVIVDYAHSPDALSRLLDTVRECGPRRVITVVGCGGDRDRGKRPIMAKIATDKSDVCIFTSDNPRTEEPLDILDDMLAGVGWSMEEYVKWGHDDYYPPLPNGHRLFVYDIRSIAVRAAVAMGEEGDAVVIAGKGHETYQIIGKAKEYFDDREECRDALQHVDALHAAGVDTSEFPWRGSNSIVGALGIMALNLSCLLLFSGKKHPNHPVLYPVLLFFFPYLTVSFNWERTMVVVSVHILLPFLFLSES